MLIKTFTVENPFKDGEKTDVTTYWNLTKSEISDYVSEGSGVVDRLQLAIASGDGSRIYKAIMEIMDLAYGVPAPDGLGLMKTEEIKEAYRTGPVRDALIDWIINDPDKASVSILKVLPKDFQEMAAKELPSNGSN